MQGTQVVRPPGDLRILSTIIGWLRPGHTEVVIPLPDGREIVAHVTKVTPLIDRENPSTRLAIVEAEREEGGTRFWDLVVAWQASQENPQGEEAQSTARRTTSRRAAQEQPTEGEQPPEAEPPAE